MSVSIRGNTQASMIREHVCVLVGISVLLSTKEHSTKVMTFYNVSQRFMILKILYDIKRSSVLVEKSARGPGILSGAPQ